MMLATIAVAWSIDRAAGIAALVLASCSVTLGVLSATGRVRNARAVHEALSLATIAALGVHGAAFALDPFFHGGLAGTLVPFASPYRPVAVALGQIAAYGLVVLGLGYYVRARIGVARWRAAHRFAGAFWLLGVIHALLTGTDALAPWFLAAVLGPIGAGLVALSTRVPALRRGPTGPAPARPNSLPAHGPPSVAERTADHSRPIRL